MDSLLSSGSLGGGAMGAVGEKAVGGSIGKSTMCPQLSFKVRLGCFFGMYVFGAILVLIGVFGLKASKQINFSILKFIAPYTIGVLLSVGG